MKLNTPVLFLVFNRPDTTERVFEAIRQAKPPRLYIAADGPRQNRVGENDKCNEVRKIATAIDWPCEVRTLFREKNLGCTEAVSSAIDWFFEAEEMGIILEDDCLPTPDFFNFSEAMLLKYRDETRIMHISGSNLQVDNVKHDASYYFSSMPVIWGWATWRRAWKHYDVRLKDLDGLIEKSKKEPYFLSSDERKALLFCFDLVKYAMHTWDWQWIYTIKKERGLCITPYVNLISNIGFGHADATATVEISSNSNIPTQEIGKITDPKSIEIDFVADKFFVQTQFPYNWKMRVAYFLGSISRTRPGIIFHKFQSVYKRMTNF